MTKIEIGEPSSLYTRDIEASPYSANAYDGMTDGCAKAGMWKEAVHTSDKAVELAIGFDHPARTYFIEQAKKMKVRLKSESENSK